MEKKYWPHAPLHQLSAGGTFLVTAGTYHKDHHFKTNQRLDVLERGLLKVTAQFGWRVEAWAVFSNHYHFVAHSPPDTAETLSPLIQLLHNKTASWINRLDNTRGRQVWHNFWETRLTFQKAFLTRLNYVHQNPVKHGIVPVAHLYPWCSARWFERTASPAQVRSLYKFKTDSVHVLDEFTPISPSP